MSNAPQIIGIVLVRNEDRFIERVIINIAGFCDSIIITDNGSTDGTLEILQKLASIYPHIEVSSINHPKESHKAIERYAGTNTWIFAVDGDEIYDPVGLQIMKNRLKKGEFSHVWRIIGNVLNCSSIDPANKKAAGYLAPPCRSMTKLYNFALLESWTDCPERLHSGQKIFKAPSAKLLTVESHKEMAWEESWFRCLHVVFLRRSSRETPSKGNSRLNPAEIEAIRQAWQNRSFGKLLKRSIEALFGRNWKQQKYRRGPLVEKEISNFFSYDLNTSYTPR